MLFGGLRIAISTYLIGIAFPGKTCEKYAIKKSPLARVGLNH